VDHVPPGTDELAERDAGEARARKEAGGVGVERLCHYATAIAGAVEIES